MSDQFLSQRYRSPSHHNPGRIIMALAIMGVLTTLCITDNDAFGQEYTDTPSSFAVVIADGSQYVYRDAEGHSIVLGMIENRGQSFVSGIQIQAMFYGGNDGILYDVNYGPALVDVIPPESRSPFMLRSSIPHSEITHATVKVLTLEPAPSKQSYLTVELDQIKQYTANLEYNSMILTGTITNGPAPSSDTVIHVAFYDAFEPPRILAVKTIHAGDLMPSETVRFELDADDDLVPSAARTLGVFAESDIYNSEMQKSSPFSSVNLPQPVRLLPESQTRLQAYVMSVSLKDDSGLRVSSATVGERVNIETVVSVEFADMRQVHETPYVLYVKVRDSSASGTTEFVGKYDGRFVNENMQSQIIDWVPQNEGLYIAETFVWDRDGIPIAKRGPVLLIAVGS